MLHYFDSHRTRRTRSIGLTIGALLLLAGAIAAPVSAQTATTFLQLAGPAGKQVTAASAGTATFYGVMAGGQAYNWNSIKGAWEALPNVPATVQNVPNRIAYDKTGDLWVIDPSERVWSYVPPNYRPAPGALKQVSVGTSANVWGVNDPGNVYKWNPTTTTWIAEPGTCASVSVASDGTVWCLGPNDAIWRWNGTTWVAFPGALRWISVGSASNVWGVNYAGQVFKLNAAGTGWDVPVVPSGAFTGVSVASDGTVLLVRGDGTLWKGK
jgi:hypothetical protein